MKNLTDVCNESILSDIDASIQKGDNFFRQVEVELNTIKNFTWEDILDTAKFKNNVIEFSFRITCPNLLIMLGINNPEADGLIINIELYKVSITIIFINNCVYGMTGGQMAPTTLLGMKTATCPYGRDAAIHGYPLKMTEIAATLEGTAYVTRQSVHSVPAIRKAKKAIRKAFENSMNGKGSNLVEIVSTCNSGWKMSPAAANKWMEENMFPFYQLGDLKDKE